MRPLVFLLERQTVAIMPKHLQIACLLYIGSVAGMAAMAPLFEVGIWRFVSPVLALAFVIVAVLFMRRQQWTWHYMKWMAIAGIAINALFFPSPEFHDIYTVPAQFFAATEIVSSSVILWSLLWRRESSGWFTGRET